MKHRIISWILVISGFLIMLGIGSGFTRSRAARINSDGYRISSSRAMQLRVVKGNAPLYDRPYARDARRIGSVSTGQEVRAYYKATRPDQDTYYRISRIGRTLGWIDEHHLRYSSTFKLPFRYTSQFWPSKVKEACEAASLKMALSTKGRALHTSLKTMVNRIPRSSDPKKGYTGDPFHFGTGSTIYPQALAQVARKYGVHAKDVSGVSKGSLIYDIRHGNPVIFEGSFLMHDTKSDHVLTLLGYKPGYFFFADPFSEKYGVRYTGWVTTTRFMKIWQAKVRGSRALLIY